jgi:ring-1,2-phenylacetyl-CoA epoxidase subunit PaaC
LVTDPTAEATSRLTLGLGDDSLILGQRLSEWISRAPDLETDIALANIALDHLGVARALLSQAGEAWGRSEDELAMFRSEREFSNLLICEQPNGDFAQTIARLFLFDAYQLELWAELARAEDRALAGIAAKALLEARYHFRFSSDWVVRLGDGTEQSKRRMEAGLEVMAPFVEEMFEFHPQLRPEWRRKVGQVLAEATLVLPEDSFPRRGGREGLHTEHLGHLLSEMQWLARSYPGDSW